MAQAVVETKDLTKVYGESFTAVNKLNLRIEEGEVRFGSLDAPSFASDPGCDFAAMAPIIEQKDRTE